MAEIDLAVIILMMDINRWTHAEVTKLRVNRNTLTPGQDQRHLIMGDFHSNRRYFRCDCTGFLIMLLF